MIGLRTMGMAAVAGGLMSLAAAPSRGDATIKPSPPPQVCVNSQCVTTVAPVAAVVTAGSHAIKWNPGHYMASYSIIYAGDTMSKLSYEMNDLNNQDAILGYRMYLTWGALEPSQGNYDFSVIDAVLAKLKTGYNKPKRLVVYIVLYGRSPLGTNDNGVFPLYIQQNQAYGVSPVAGSYGWWGKNASGKSTGMFAPAVYYGPVMDRLIALVQALGAHLDGDPSVEALSFNEDASVAQAASALGSVSPNYTDDAWETQLQRLLSASTAAFPHTSVTMDNSWFDRPPAAIALQQWMAANRIAASTSDTWGQSSLTTYGTSHLSDGMQAYLGVDAAGGTVDLRPQSRAMVAVEGPDIFGNYFASKGGPWTPLDIINAANNTYYASHIFWTHLFGTETFYGVGVPAAAKWSNLAATVSANPLTHTDYPQNYP